MSRTSSLVARFEHDCDACKYLGRLDRHLKGRFGRFDLYWCENNGHRPNSLIARYGSEGSQYVSTLPPECLAEGYKPDEVSLEILARALARGFYKPWKRVQEREATIRMAAFDLDCEDTKAAMLTLKASGVCP